MKVFNNDESKMLKNFSSVHEIDSKKYSLHFYISNFGQQFVFKRITFVAYFCFLDKRSPKSKHC